jgi:hypothetical protein
MLARNIFRASSSVMARPVHPCGNLFKETPPHSSFDWHNDPIPQYVLTLSGVLEFTTVGSETFTIHPGDVLLAVDHTGSGRKWRLINDEPWNRAYVVFKDGANTHFVPDQT